MHSDPDIGTLLQNGTGRDIGHDKYFIERLNPPEVVRSEASSADTAASASNARVPMHKVCTKQSSCKIVEEARKHVDDEAEAYMAQKRANAGL